MLLKKTSFDFPRNFCKLLPLPSLSSHLYTFSVTLTGNASFLSGLLEHPPFTV